MKDRRKKVFLMSIFSFLVIAGVVYIFLILTAVDEVKKKSYFVSNYSPANRALLPVFKYLKMIDSESVASLAKSLIPEDFKKVGDVFSSSSFSSSASSDNLSSASSSGSSFSGSAYTSSKRYESYSYDKTSFKPSSKLSSSVGSGADSVSSGGVSQTSSNLSDGFSGSSVKNVSVNKNNVSETGGLKNDGNTLIARLNYTKSSLGSAIKSKSADAARLDWERGFSGSVKPEGGMFYRDNAIELDKIKSGVENLKFEDSKGLHEPAVSSPKIDSNVSSDKAKEMINNLAQDMAKSMINSLGNAISGGMGGGGAAEEEDPRQKKDSIIAEDPAADKLTKTDEDKIKQEVEKWKFDPNENVTTTYFSCQAVNCDKLGINGDGFYKAYFPDGFVLTLNNSGKVVDYYYCVSPVNESAFLENYQKYVVGSN